MIDCEGYLEKLSAFSRLLQAQGLSVSPGETADAGQILLCLDLTDRQQVKTALRTIYAKTREEQLTFDRTFDQFFLSEEAIRARAKQQQEQNREMEERKRQADEELQLSGKPISLSQQQRETYLTMPENAREKLRSFLEKYRTSAERNPKLYGDFIHSVFARSIMEQQLLMEDAAVGAAAEDPELGILYRDLSKFQDAEIPKAIEMIQKAARQVNGELSARSNRKGHTGKLDFRPTIRKGLETGGSFYRLKYKKRPHHRRHLVLLCDVSGSMIQFSEFALRFILSLNQVSESSRTFLFSETMVEMDPFQMQNMKSFRDHVKETGIYGRGTDLGRALEQLCLLHPSPLGSAATLLILSDAKTIDQAHATAALKEAKHKAGRVLWLNPIPESQWQYLNSTRTFSALCPMVPCSTLRELTEALRGQAL